MTDASQAGPVEPGAPARRPRTEIDMSVPHSARVWNYWLGGSDNYAVDRKAGNAYAALFPDIRKVARAQRDFLARSVRWLAGPAGVRQFLDIGMGLPSAGNTHEVAQRVACEARIVYVDNDPLVLAHARALLIGTPEGATAYIDADLRDTATIMQEARHILDFTKPVALILHGILGHVEDASEARSIVRELLDGLPSGSYLDLADGTIGDAGFMRAQDKYNESGAAPYTLRKPEEIAGFFQGLELVEPGVVSCPLWRPDTVQAASAELDVYGGVARKR